MTTERTGVRWRAERLYNPTSVMKPALIEETRRFLLTYGQSGDIADTRRWLVSTDLPQRSIRSRVTLAKVIRSRLVGWNPPDWVLEDLVAFAGDVDRPSLPSALLLHLARQDAFLYDLVQHLIVPRWRSGERTLARADVQRFLDAAEPDHPEIGGWTHATRQKAAGNVLTLLRDHGLLRGSAQKWIVEPAVPPLVARHLVRLLHAEGVRAEEMADHPDWHLWLFDGRRAQAAVAEALEEAVL